MVHVEALGDLSAPAPPGDATKAARMITHRRSGASSQQQLILSGTNRFRCVH